MSQTAETLKQTRWKFTYFILTYIEFIQLYKTLKHLRCQNTNFIVTQVKDGQQLEVLECLFWDPCYVITV